MNWDMLDACFCSGERSFAEHPGDWQTAFDVLTELRARRIGWTRVERELRRRLGDMPKLDAEAEVKRVQHYFGCWLLD